MHNLTKQMSIGKIHNLPLKNRSGNKFGACDFFILQEALLTTLPRWLLIAFYANLLEVLL